MCAEIIFSLKFAPNLCQNALGTKMKFSIIPSILEAKEYSIFNCFKSLISSKYREKKKNMDVRLQISSKVVKNYTNFIIKDHEKHAM